MFFEQYSHEPYVATPRYICRTFPPIIRAVRSCPSRLEKGRAALGVMEEHLRRAQFFVDERYTIADIALYAYTHVADEGGLDLGPYANAQWLERVAAQPGHVGIDARPPADEGRSRTVTRLGGMTRRDEASAHRWLFDANWSGAARPSTLRIYGIGYLADEAQGARRARRARRRPPAAQSARIRSAAPKRSYTAIRRRQQDTSGVDALLREYDLLSGEGVVLMCLAEALLRIPDAATADRLIADKLGSRGLGRHTSARASRCSSMRRRGRSC